MEKKKECKIIQDLLPNYIEKLTSEDTNDYIKNHLKECKDCTDVFNAMQKDFKLSENNVDKRKIDYIKKYNKKILIFKVILLIILLVFILFIIHTLRNYIIINQLYGKYTEQEKNINSNSYIEYNGTDLTIKQYKKDNITKTIILDNKNDSIITQLVKPTETITYWDNSKNHTMSINNELDGISQLLITNYTYTENIFVKILSSMLSRIYTTNINDTECYVIEGFAPNYVYNANTQKVSFGIEKDTGLLLEIIEGKEYRKIYTYSYNFGIVTDEDVAELDSSNYQMINN